MKINSHVIKSTMVGALGGLLFGFDTAVISGTTSALSQTYHLSSAMLGITVSSALLGTVIGAMTASIPGQKYGRRDSLRMMAIFYVISAIGCALAWNWSSLILFRFIGGLGIGGSSVLGPMYIAEIAPATWRGRLVGFFQVNIVVGILLAYVSNAIIDTMGLGPNEWRWQLGVSGVPAVLFLIALFGIPRSPRWLVMQSRNTEAIQVLQLIGVQDPNQELEEIRASIHTAQGGATASLFSRQYRFPVFLAVTVGMFCQLSGINAILYYLNDIFALAGTTKVSGALQAIAVGATNLVATLIAMSVIDRFGRKKLLLTGTFGLTICLIAVSYIFVTHKYLGSLVWLLMAYIAFFAVSQGAVVWVYISEVFPNSVRSKGQALGSSSHWITNAVISLFFPMMAGSSGAYPFMFFAAMMVLDFFLILKYYPETKGITLEKMQDRFSH
jgi:sugar porter (SP) family MFS transporter